MPLPNVLAFNAPHIVTAAEAAANEYYVRPLHGPCFLINVVAQNANNPNTLWDVAIQKETIDLGNLESFEPQITLFQREAQRGLAYDIIWEGRRYMPKHWVLYIVASENLVVNDVLHIHGGYEGV